MDEREIEAALRAAGAARDGVRCPPPESLAAYVDGRLEDAAEREVVEEHAAACRACRAALAAAGASGEEAEEAPAAEAPRRRSGRRRVTIWLSARPARPLGPAVWVAAAAAVVALAFVALLRWGGEGGPARPEVARGGSDEPASSPGSLAPASPRPEPDIGPEPDVEPESEALARAGLPAHDPAPSVEETAPAAPPPGDPSAVPPAPRAGPRARGEGVALASVLGPLEVRRQAAASWAPVGPADTLAPGDVLRGGEGAASRVLLGGRASLALEPGAVAVVVEDEPGGALRLSLEQGAIEVAARSRAEVHVLTGFSEAAGVGARFRLERRGDYVSLRTHYGAVTLEAAGRRVIVHRWQRSSVRAGEPPRAPRRSSSSRGGGD